MKTKTPYVIAVLFLVVSCLVAGRPDGGSARCAVQKFEAELEASKAVFIGKVTEIEKTGDTKIFTFAVERFWKGIESGNVKVAVFENPRFQAQFREGGRFLVFAKEDEDYGLYDGRCSRSRDLDQFAEGAEEDLEKLGEGETFSEDEPKEPGTGESGAKGQS